VSKQNIALDKTISFLGQPISFGALFLLFINDHLLRTKYDSWVFGKLGDFAWLFIFPPLLIVLWSVVFRPRSNAQTKTMGIAAYGLTATIFTLANLFGGFNDFILGMISTFLGKPVSLVSDPTDLIALLALFVSWKLWDQQKVVKGPRWRGVIAIPIISVLTIANAPAANYGICCLDSREGILYAGSQYQNSVYKSVDGGMTWKMENDIHLECEDFLFDTNDVTSPQKVIQGGKVNVLYAFDLGGPIELSEDNGETWTEIYPSRHYREIEKMLYEERVYSAVISEGPNNAVYDKQHDHVIFAMGHQGALVLDSEGEWHAVAVGEYVPYESVSFSEKFSYLTGEIFVSLGLALLLFQVMSLRMIRNRRQKVIVGMSCAVFIPTVFLVRPFSFQSNYYGAYIFLAGYYISAFLLPVGVLDTITRLFRDFRRYIPRMLLLGIISGALYFALLVLWLADILPYYLLAKLIGFSMAAFLYFLWQRGISEDPYVFENKIG
jgi:hypothetical protein